MPTHAPRGLTKSASRTHPAPKRSCLTATAKASKNFYIIYWRAGDKIFSFKKALNFCWL